LPHLAIEISVRCLKSMLGQRVSDALLDRFVLSPQRHLVVLRVFFDFGTTSCCRLLYACFVGLVCCFHDCWTEKESSRDECRECPIHQKVAPSLQSAPVTFFARLCDSLETRAADRDVPDSRPINQYHSRRILEVLRYLLLDQGQHVLIGRL
jgi:hypothetical protein